MMEPPASGGKSVRGEAVRPARWRAVLANAATLLPWRWSRRRVGGGTPPMTPEEFDAAEPGRGRAATAPWLIPPRGWKDILWRTQGEIGRARLPLLAAGVTFFLLLATFPAIAAFVALYGMFTDVAMVEHHFASISDLLPRDAVHVISEEMVRVTRQHNSTLGVTFLVTTLISVWSANAGMKALFDGVNIAYDEVEKRSWLRRTLFTYFATLAGLLLLTTLTVGAVSVPMAAPGLGVRDAAPVVAAGAMADGLSGRGRRYFR